MREASRSHDAREYDAVVATGEQVTAGLLAIVLQSMAHPGPFLAGLADPDLTDNAHGVARIKDIPGDKIRDPPRAGRGRRYHRLPGHRARSQPRSPRWGRGGSDTSAVAFAVAVQADLCDIYTDVDGVYTTDPRIVPRARRLTKVSYEEMLEMASLGSKVLQTAIGRARHGAPDARARAVELRAARQPADPLRPEALG